MLKYDVIIAGAGIVGLATAYKMLEKKPGLKLCLVEKEEGVSRHQTGNNSGVIHSGIYYKPGSLKALNCIKGYKMLLDFCDANGIAYDICGKVIVATDESELRALGVLYEKGIANGLEGLKMLSAGELKEYEPHISGIKGIHVPQTGIIDYMEVSKKIAELVYDMGAEIRFSERLDGIYEKNGDVLVHTNKNNYSAKILVTCAGLQSDRVAKLNNKDLKLRIVPFRGEYYKIKEDKKYLVKNLIYPVPDPQFPFLGVHYTRKMNGEIEAGPNAVFAFKREGYKKTDIDFGDMWESMAWGGFMTIARKYWRMGMMEFYRSFSKPAFTRSLQRLTPEVMESDLEEGGAGVRAQACDNKGNLVDDFLFVENERVLHVCNAPSPAATSCFSIGDTIAEKVMKL